MHLVKTLIWTIIMTNLMQPAVAQLSDEQIRSNTREVQVGELTFPVFDQGSGEVVVLLHGFPDSRFMWRYQIPVLLEAGFRVIAPDLKGYGDAPKPQEVSMYTIPILVGEIMTIIGNLQIDKFNLVGHDWGAALSWVIASSQPEKVNKLVALSVGAPGNSGTKTFDQLKAGWYGYLIANSEGVEELLMRDDWKFMKELTQGDGDQERYIRDFSRPGALTAALNYYRANFKADFKNIYKIPPVKCDVLGIWGDRDIYLMESHMKNSSELVEGKWRYEKVNDASHWLMLDKPEQVNRLIVDFFAE